VVGLAAVGVLYRAGEAGGDLVYSYAGGVGIRSGDPADVNRLLIAAAHHQAALDRQAGKMSDAAQLMDLVAARFPDQLELQLAQVDSVLNDRKSPQGALTRLDGIRVPTDDVRMRVRAGLLRANALAAAGDMNAAKQVLETLKAEFPANPQIQRRLAELSQPRS
jgi:predicted Zn-dependent protease